jgi:hypothetical protein
MSKVTMFVGSWIVDIDRVNESELDVECTKDTNGKVVKMSVYTKGYPEEQERACGFEGFHRFPVQVEIALEKMGIDTTIIAFGRGK